MYHEDDIADAEISEFIRLNRKELEDIVSGMILIRESLSSEQVDEITHIACVKFEDQTSAYQYCDAHVEAMLYVSHRLAHFSRD